ncbi:MAG: FtsX-like permease family protein [Planctomycetota bacterium]|nr:FtsX-like permease family protein [Planctomycetota bacterium]
MYRLFLALRYLRSRLVNLISVGGVMAGVAVLIIVMCIMDGFQARVRKHVRGSLSHIILTPTTGQQAPPTFARLEQALKAGESHVVAAAPQIRYPIFYEYQTQRQVAYGGDGFTWWQMEAVGVDWEAERRVSELADGLLACRDPERPFFVSREAEARGKTTLLVSRTFVERFALTPYDDNGAARYPYGAMRDDRTGARLEDDATIRERAETLIGQELQLLYGTALKDEAGNPRFDPSTPIALIAGVYDSGDSLEDLKTVFMDIEQVRGMLPHRLDHSTNPPGRHPPAEYLQVNVRLDDFEHADLVRGRLEERLGHAFIVETWEDQKADFLRAVEQEKVLLVIVLSFIVMLSGFIILATLTLTVVEKTRDIGIVAALGASRTGILSIFLFNGLLIGILGSLLGLGLGAWFTANVDVVKDFLHDWFGIDIFPPNIYHFRSIPTVWHWPSVLKVMGGSVLMSFVAGLLPAMRAARLDPIKSLRYE